MSINVLTFDIEEWFHILDNDSTRMSAQWDNFEVRIYENVDRILNILQETDTKATFFIIGWIAQKYPDLVRKISLEYEIGTHTMNHQLVWQQKPDEFKKDVLDSITILQDITGKKVNIFRAPGFSIRETEGWAIEILNDLGISIDCSIFPAKGSHGGMPSYSEDIPSILNYKNIKLKEFPVPVKKIAGRNVVFNGGGYFRLFPYTFIKKWTKERDYSLCYIHPRDFDYKQPVLEDLSLLRKFKSYYGLKTAEEKFKQYLQDFNFTDISTAEKNINWSDCPVVSL